MGGFAALPGKSFFGGNSNRGQLRGLRDDALNAALVDVVGLALDLYEIAQESIGRNFSDIGGERGADG